MKRIKKCVFLILGVLFAVAGTLSAEPTHIIVLHTNDMHGRISADENLAGMAYIATAVADYREQFEHVLLLDAGDALHGRPITDKLEGESAVLTMNRAGYNALAPGNHDFNYGWERLVELTETMEFDLLAANVLKDGELLFSPYAVYETGGYSVGIFGLATSDTYTSTHPKNVVGIDFADTVETSQRYVEILRNTEGVDLVIALTHVGLDQSTAIAENVRGIDLIVDGHSHSLLPDGRRVGDTLIVQANEYTKYLGLVEIVLDNGVVSMDAQLIPAVEVKERYQPDEAIVEMLDEFSQEITRMLLGF